MDIAIVAPCPIPYMIGGAENLCRGLQDHLNENTSHQAELIKLPSRELEFWDLIDSYRRFAELDLTGFDIVVSSKYPAWMVHHPRHVIYMLHRLRGLYDTYDVMQLPPDYPDPPRAVVELRAFMEQNAGRREALPEFFERVAALRGAPGVREDLFAFPGPFIRELVHFLDAVGLAPEAIARYGAISAAVAERDGYFPVGEDVFVVHPPTGLEAISARERGKYLFTVSRLDRPKRIHLLIEAMKHVRSKVDLWIAGTGPAEAELHEQAAGDKRIVFTGRVSNDRLALLYTAARAVAFIPHEEDFGLVTLEAMRAGKPVITATDSGATAELVSHGVNGLIVEPTPEALAAAIDELWSDRRAAKRMGRVALERAKLVSWDALVRELERVAA
jgi:glycosyltransferase involved in cell wall biosynthesis